ncbi:MAG: redoxin domain-containing protein [Chitinophagales bacterium]|nr:redoxin domain-containing protein [Chitinophagales bacterium]
MPVVVGELAPDFALYDTDKKKVSLKDYRGKNIVLLFFPFAFSSVCSKELCEVRDNYSFYEKLNAPIIAISVDSLYTNAKFKELNKFNFLLLSDFNKEVSRKYDSLIENFNFDYQGVSKRSTFVIDKKGKIVYAEILANPGDYPDMQKLKDAVTSLNY